MARSGSTVFIAPRTLVEQRGFATKDGNKITNKLGVYARALAVSRRHEPLPCRPRHGALGSLAASSFLQSATPPAPFTASIAVSTPTPTPPLAANDARSTLPPAVHTRHTVSSPGPVNRNA